MSSYHFSVQVISRSNGRSAIAAAAYRSGQRLIDEGRGAVADYSRRRGVVYAEILAPDGSAPWLKDRQSLWNGVERMEKRADAQLAREINLALPHEIPESARLELVRRFVREQFVALGMVADVAIHRPVPEKGDDPRNHHAHIMLTMRQATGSGLRQVKTRHWNSDSLLRHWREQWARYQNAMLRVRAPAPVREVDHRTLPQQREAARRRGDRAAVLALHRLPELHVGPRAMNAARRGYVPASRDREARGWPGRRAGASAPRHRQSRVVRYSRIDTGTRFEANLKRLRHNLDRTDRVLVRYQARAARLRSCHHVEGRRGVRTGKRPMKPASVAGPRQRRRSQIAALIRKIEQLIAVLFGLREMQLHRRLRLCRSIGLRQRHDRIQARRRGRRRLR
ncbi:MobQ family relaxase [Bradyrhizobium sp. Arg314]